MMNTLFLGYAIFMVIGGFIGYKAAGSKMSLIMGIVSGIVVLLGVYISQSNATAGYCTISAMAAILTLVFFIRLSKTKKFMPSGMLMILSVAALILAVMQLS